MGSTETLSVTCVLATHRAVVSQRSLSRNIRSGSVVDIGSNSTTRNARIVQLGLLFLCNLVVEYLQHGWRLLPPGRPARVFALFTRKDTPPSSRCRSTTSGYISKCPQYPHFHTYVILDDWTQTSVKRGYLTSGLTASGAGVKLPVFQSDNTPGSDPFLNGY